MPTFYGPPSDGTVIPEQLETALAADIAAPGSPIRIALDAAGLGQVPEDTLRGVISATEPASPTLGMLWFDTSTPFTADSLDSLAGLMARWRADDLVLDDGAEVSTVAPRSGSVSVSLSAPAGYEPVLSTAFAGTHKALSFTGANSDHMAFKLPAYDAPVTVFSVVDIKSSLTYVYGGQADANHVGLLTNTAGSTVRINGPANGPGGITEAWAPGGGAAVVAGVYVPGAGAGRFYYNKLTATTGTVSTEAMTGLGPMYLGRLTTVGYGGAGAAFDLADIAFVSGELTDDEIKTVMQDLANYYGLTLGA